MSKNSLFCRSLGALAICSLLVVTGCGNTLTTTATNGTCTDYAHLVHSFLPFDSNLSWQSTGGRTKPLASAANLDALNFSTPALKGRGQ